MTAAVVPPARQRLQANHAIGAQIDLRLILNGQFFIIQRVMQIGSDGDFGSKEVVQRFRIEPVCVSAFLIRDGQHRVGPVEIVTRSRQLRMIERNTDTHRYVYIDTKNLKGVRE